MVHDINALRASWVVPTRHCFTTNWPDEVTYPTVTTVFGLSWRPRVVVTWSYLTECAIISRRWPFWEIPRVRIQFPSPFLSTPTPVECKGWKTEPSRRKRSTYLSRAFKRNCCTSTPALPGREPLTNGSMGREDYCSVAAISCCRVTQLLAGSGSMKLVSHQTIDAFTFEAALETSARYGCWSVEIGTGNFRGSTCDSPDCWKAQRR